jgi:type IV pilus assembly protein PilM
VDKENREKVDQMIRYEAQQNVPFPIEEVVWDYQLIGGAEGEIDVMLAAVKAEIIEQITDAVEKAGLEPDLIDVAPMALYNAVRYNYSDLPRCTLVADIGARSTDLIFIEQGRVFSRSIPVAGNAITQQIMTEFGLSFLDAEELKKAHAFVAFGGVYEGPKSEVVDKVSKSVRSVMTRMHADINRSINFYRSQQAGRSPSQILLTGGTSVIPYTDTFLKDKLKVEVDYLNPFLNVAVSENIGADEVGRTANLMGQVVGLGLRKVLTCPIEINLMPPKVIERKKFRKKQPWFVLSAMGMVLLIAVWCAYLIKMTGLAKERLDKARAVVHVLQNVEAELRQTKLKEQDIRGKIEKLLSVGDKRSQWLQILDQIHKCVSPGMWLVSVRPASLQAKETSPASQPQAGGIRYIEISGLGYVDMVTSENILEFRDRLRNSAGFTPETEITWQPASAPDDYMIQFSIRIALKSPLSI